MQSSETRMDSSHLLEEAKKAEIAWTQAKTPQERILALKRVTGAYDALSQMDPKYKGETTMYEGLLFNAEKQLQAEGGVDQFFSESDGKILEEKKFQEEEEDGVVELRDQIEVLDTQFIDMNERYDGIAKKVEDWQGPQNDPELLAAKRDMRVLQKRMDRIDQKIEELEDEIQEIERRVGEAPEVSESSFKSVTDEIIKKYNINFGVQEGTIATRRSTPEMITEMEDSFMDFFKDLSEEGVQSEADREVFKRIIDRVDGFYGKVGVLDGESIGRKKINLQRNMVDQYISLARKKLGL
ncbi:MAG: hypothetical protein ABII02_02570 [Candidatus Magasanikbacteria bacterium]